MKIIIPILLSFSLAWAQPQNASTSTQNSNDKSDALEAFDYPELQVVPRASERVLQEAIMEKEDTLLADWPIMLPSVLTLLNGSQLSGKHRDDANEDDRDQMKWASTTATLIGGSTLALAYYLRTQDPANESVNDLKKISAQNKRGQLHRERISEEFLESQASLHRKIKWLTMGSQFVVNGWLYDLAPDKNRPMVALAALTTFLPLVFESRSVTNYENHLRAKRRIYIPISGVIMTPGKTANASYEATAGLTWAWGF